MKIFFKHSNRCPISAGAKIEVDSFLRHYQDGEEFKFDYELIDVIGNRGRSSEIAEKYGITHESPQIIIVDDNDNVKWHASHRKIDEEGIVNAMK